ncbi:SDR family oxidoreductase [Pyxidicoccus fallax]|uniref:SDR family oxidoreductase n=1 Tax=Pyxidicoccus fallax TaxID=394095 RepID=A0A848LNT0_9BACT|nr:type I polyketide synthase [Pyxidicoccus fallax]NMO19517.1 SDR family oxidoreductase [Pyxidicoccus fallax]NPC80486.1 SDR family oxidoreductase [Pyxidicoccus fallax]
MPNDIVADDQDIAIIGMTGRFPGAPDLDTFWRNLREGVESIRSVGDAELEALGVDAALRKDASWVKASAALEGMELFDAGFFGYTPREAELMDPQHRVFLECCWEALEHAGYAPESFKGAVGVFGGAPTNTYLLHNLVPNADQLSMLDQVQIDVANGGDFLGTRVAYKLNLRGPSYSIASACSTSLVATHVACQSLLNEECDIALAGGVSVHVKHPEGYRYLPGGIVSPDGHCRAFDAKADGTVFGSGAGVVVLKRLRDALEDGDSIHAVIKGSAINNDGSVKVGYTAPSVEGQAAVISEALGAAGVEPESIGYVEAHGTGTKMGDPIEVRALTKAFRPRKAATPAPVGRKIPIGSVKTNIGHLANAAGVSSLIKAVLSLEHHELPPSLHFEQPSPEIDFEGSPFYVNAKLEPWPANPKHPRRAGVSSFGVGGTNAHVVLQEAPALPPSGPSRKAQLLVLSARSASALDAATQRLARHLRAHPEQPLSDVAYTLQVGRQPMSHRRVLLCTNREDALAALEAEGTPRCATGAPSVQDRPVAFLFPGQGSQYVGMARGLYEAEPVFREHLDSCATGLLPHLGLDLRTVLYPDAAGAEEAARKLGQTALTQPALFAVEYALARLWMSWGVKPQAMLGHSIGEYVAACLAGVFTLPDALALVAKRGALMQSLPAGAMLSVQLPEDEVRPHLTPALSVAAVNGPRLTVVAGPTEAIAALQSTLEARGVGVARLHTSHAFHSAMMDPILPAFTDAVRAVKLNAPKLPFLSNVTGTWIDAAQATDPAYWARHLREAVRFDAGLRELAKKPQLALLEVGPGTTLVSLARQQPGAGERVAVSCTRHPRETSADDVTVLLNALGRLWLDGVHPDWAGFSKKEQRRRMPLPSYPFERQRYWIDARPGSGLGAVRPAAAPSASSAALEKKSDPADWFYVPSWKRAPLSRSATATGPAASLRSWLLFADGTGVADALAARLTAAGHSVVRVVPGTEFGQRNDGSFAVDPKRREDQAALLDSLQAQGQTVEGVVHLWGVTSGNVLRDEALGVGFDSLVSLAQALGAQSQPRHLMVVASGAAKVERADTLVPELATLLGACRVVPQEYPHLTCRLVDVDPGAESSALVERLLAEFFMGAAEPVVAWRGRQRWVQTFEPLRLEEDAASSRPLRERGVYLVTDGLEGPGLVLSKELARTFQARLALVEGPDFPAREQWAQWLATHEPTDATRRKVEAAQALEASGAEVLVLGTDTSDAAQVKSAVARTMERFGGLHGVIHAAGGLRGAMLGAIQDLGPEQRAAHVTPSLHSLRALAEALPADGLDFVLLMSSLSSVLGGLGQVAHAATSAFTDAFAEARSDAGSVPWHSVGWDAWKLDEATALGALAKFALSPEEGVSATRRILAGAAGGPIAVCTADLAARRQAVRAPSRAQAGATPGARKSHPRPALAAAYVAPRSDLERTLTSVWQAVLGIEPIGIDDNFFELGGDSLLAVQASAQLRQALQVEVPAATLYQRPTARSLAELLGEGDAAARERADKLAKRKEELSRRNQWLHRRQK